MNCKQGDLAIVVSCDNNHQDIGAIRTVVEPLRCPCGCGAPGWGLDADLPSGNDCILDECLRPIRDNDGEDETLTWAGKPEQVMA